MKRKTDLNAVKTVARNLLMTDVHETKFSPIVVIHPFTSTGIVGIKHNGELEILDITQSYANRIKWQKAMKEQINEAKNAFEIYMLTNKTYSLTFLKFARSSLSREDFSTILASAWIRSESPNGDINVSQKELISMFGHADSKALMTEQEREELDELDDVVTIYRGVTPHNADRIRAMSWTLNYKTAEWFAHRFDEDGTIYEAQIKKENILALFNGRNESEIIVEPRALENITEAQEPTQGFTQKF